MCLLERGGRNPGFQFFTTDDQVKLAYSVQGTGRPVVFVSGYSAAGELWFSQVKACVQAGCQAIVFDRRSHGYSENPDYGQSMQRHGQDLNQLIQHLGIVKPVLVGQSMGTSTLFSYLNQYGEGDISAVIDIDQTPKILNDADWKQGMYNSEQIDYEHFLDREFPSPFYKRVPLRVFFRVLLLSRKLPKFVFCIDQTPFPRSYPIRLAPSSGEVDYSDTIPRRRAELHVASQSRRSRCQTMP